eukprot:c10073_g1_i2.p1 GENE.c10073_g1_i2~~c10073_g1_i2.p1  ORF type:complete len:134 (+),score=33.12 c10073_g1_i2:53-454(+)
MLKANASSAMSPDSYYEAGLEALKKNDTKTAKTMFEYSCEGRHPQGCFEFGQMFFNQKKVLLGTYAMERGCNFGEGRACFALARHIVLTNNKDDDASAHALKYAYALFVKSCELGHEPGCKGAQMLSQHKETE